MRDFDMMLGYLTEDETKELFVRLLSELGADTAGGLIQEHMDDTDKRLLSDYLPDEE